MANDPLGLSPDPSLADPQSEDYLGRLVPLAFKGQPALPVTGAAAVGAPSTPASVGGSSAASSTGGGGSAGGGSFMDWARRLLAGGMDLSKLLGGGTDLGTRGDTGGVSLSDYLRSLQAEDPSSQVSGGELALGAEEAGSGAGQQLTETAIEQGLDIPLEGLGWATAGTLPIIEAFFGRGALMSGGGSRGPAQLRETEGIRKDFASAFPILKGAKDDLSPFASLPGVDQPEARRAALLGIINQGGLQIDQFPAISQFMSTEGGRQSGGEGSIHIDPLDVSGFGRVTGGLENTALLSTIAAIDLLGQMGPLPTEAETQGTTFRNPFAESPLNTISQLGESAGIPSKVFRGDPNYDASIPRAFDQATGQWYTTGPDGQMTTPTGAPPERPLTPEEATALQTPGQAMPTLRAIFQSVNPDFDATPLGLMMAQMTGGSGPVSPGAEAPAGADAAAQSFAGSDFADFSSAAMGAGGGEDFAAEQVSPGNPLTPATGRV